MSRKKTEIVTFKADGALLEALESVANRSEFIRSALMSALDGTCPLCGGAGRLTAAQKTHWNALAADHPLAKCRQCHEVHLVCTHRPNRRAHPPKGKRPR